MDRKRSVWLHPVHVSPACRERRSGTRPVAFRWPESFGGLHAALPLRRPSLLRARGRAGARRSLTRPSTGRLRSSVFCYFTGAWSFRRRGRAPFAARPEDRAAADARPLVVPLQSSGKRRFAHRRRVGHDRRASRAARQRRQPARRACGSPRRSHALASGLRRQETGTSRPMAASSPRTSSMALR